MKIPRREEQLEFRLSFKVMFSNMLQIDVDIKNLSNRNMKIEEFELKSWDVSIKDLVLYFDFFTYWSLNYQCLIENKQWGGSKFVLVSLGIFFKFRF